MAKIEVKKILASSKDNFLVFSNSNYARPYVTFHFNGNGSNSGGSIVVSDALNDDGYNKTISYLTDSIISDSSFKYVHGNAVENTFGLLECLKKNSIFYDIQLINTSNTNTIAIKAFLDTSTRYSFKVSPHITLGGNFNTYTPKEPNKFVLMLNDNNNQIVLEKYSVAGDVSFNVTAPFQHISTRNPIYIRMLGYHIDNNSIVTETITNNTVTVMPTTLSKFSDIDYSKYNYEQYGKKVDFLTNKLERDYNYGEYIALSILTNRTGLTFLKKYYTVSGKYLGSEEITANLRREITTMRTDVYMQLNLDMIETQTNMQVGYVEVVAIDNGIEITNPVRFNVVPKCNQNNTIYFVNEIGGIDSFNFLGERSYKSKIADQSTYFKNPTRKYSNVKELEIVGQKKNNVEHTLTTTIIGNDTALWLNELAKSKYVFLLEDDYVKHRIVVTSMNIELSDRENTFEIELTYHDGDTNIAI